MALGCSHFLTWHSRPFLIWIPHPPSLCLTSLYLPWITWSSLNAPMLYLLNRSLLSTYYVPNVVLGMVGEMGSKQFNVSSSLLQAFAYTVPFALSPPFPPIRPHFTLLTAAFRVQWGSSVFGKFPRPSPHPPDWVDISFVLLQPSGFLQPQTWPLSCHCWLTLSS